MPRREGSKHPIEAQVENLFLQERAPLIVTIPVGPLPWWARVNGQTETQKEINYCFIPPEGTQFGDTIDTWLGGYLTFSKVPGKKNCGFAERLELTGPQARRVQRQVNKLMIQLDKMLERTSTS
jgi:hypothetical protein